MRDGQARLVDRLLAVEQQIEVDRARPEARAFPADTAEPALDLEQTLEELARRQRGLELRGDGDEPTLTPEALAERIGESLASDDEL